VSHYPTSLQAGGQGKFHTSAISKCKKKQEKQDLRPHLVRYYLACCRRV